MPTQQPAPAPAGIRIELRRGAAMAAVNWAVPAAEQCAARLSSWLR